MQIGMGMGICGGRQDDLLVDLTRPSAPGRVSGGVTVTRASGAWGQDDEGVWQYVPAGTSFANSWGDRFEPASTNKVTAYGVIPADTLGAELITVAADRDFSSDTGWWTKSNATISGGVATSTGVTGYITRTALLTLGKMYRVSFTVAGYTGGNAGISGSTTTASDRYVNANGSFTRTIIATGSELRFVADTGTTFDNVSCQEVQYAVGTKSYWTGSSFVQNHTNMTLSGDQAAILSTVTDEAELTAAGLANLSNALGGGFKCYKLDNSAGVASAVVLMGGTTGNVNLHTGSAFMRASAGTGVVRVNATWVITTTSAAYGRLVEANVTPSDTGRGLRVDASAGGVVYFLALQLEESPFCTSPMPTAGASATRAATSLSFPSAGNVPLNNFSIYLEYTALRAGISGDFSKVASLLVDNNNRLDLFLNSNNSTNPIGLAKRETAQSNIDLNPPAATLAAGNLYKIAVRQTTAGLTVWNNGGQSSSSAALAVRDRTAAVSMVFGGAPGYIRNLKIHRTAYSDAYWLQKTAP